MKKFVCILLLLCCVTMIFTLASCTPDSGDGPDTGPNGGNQVEDDTPALPLFGEDGTFLYKLIRPDTNSNEIKQIFIELRKAVNDTFNISV